MSYADELFIKNCRNILENGVWDTDYDVRPRWEDGTPAHTVKIFGVVDRYDLQKEFPMMTLRRTAWKSALDELLWIWQKKSNDIHELGSHIWDSWADENGTIGKAYGYQLGVKHKYAEGWFDQVDRVIYDLKNNPHEHLQPSRPVRDGSLPLRLQHDIQRKRKEAERDPEPALAGHADREQLEHLPVRHADHDDGAGGRS